MRALRPVLCCVVLLGAFGAALEPARTGEFRLTKTLTEVLGADVAGRFAAVQPPDKLINWQVFVPAAYDAEHPAGVLVYISPTASGKLPAWWDDVLAERNLIWIGADDAGNMEHVQKRALLALIAPSLIGREYAIDPDRVYVTGLSGGGKMASMVATDHANVFKGAIYNCGVEFWDGQPAQLDRIRQNRYVFITGEHDQALRPTRRAYSRYRRAGVEHVKLMVIRGMGHENPDPDRLAEALDFLDG
jgi:hypothetical protein